MRRILIVSQHFPPDGAVGARRALRMAAYMAEFGWNTEVLTVRAEYHDRQDPTSVQRHPPYDVIRTRALLPLRWGRMLRDATPWLGRGRGSHREPDATAAAVAGPASEEPAMSLWRSLLTTPDEYVGWIPVALCAGVLHREPPDLILASGPPFSAHVIAAGLSRILAAPLALDYRDPWTFVPAENPGLGAGRRLLRHLESWCVRRASVVIATTRAIAGAMGPLRPRRTEVIPNAADPEAVARATPRRDPRFCIVHAGNFYGSRSPLPLLKAIRLLKERNAVPVRGLVLRVLGATGDLATGPAAAMGIGEHVESEKTLPYDEALAHLRGADVLLLVVGASHGGMVPAKLFDYLAARRFILAIGPPGCEAGCIVREAGAGELIGPDDVEGIVRVLEARLQAPRTELPEPAILDRYSPRRTMAFLDSVLRGILPNAIPARPPMERPGP